ncbi:MAG: hypothetical protein IT544_00430 [Rhodobacteraceae bacterium]|nr:hypothetical protein [Paracoccaceae bacterium]
MNTSPFTPIATAAQTLTLRVLIERIARKTKIMSVEATRGTKARTDAEEISLLAEIALKCLNDTEKTRHV